MAGYDALIRWRRIIITITACVSDPLYLDGGSRACNYRLGVPSEMDITSSHPDITDESFVCAEDRIGFTATQSSPGTSGDYYHAWNLGGVATPQLRCVTPVESTQTLDISNESPFTAEGSLGASPDVITLNNEAQLQQQQQGGVSQIRQINEFTSMNNHIFGVSHSFCAEEHIGTLAWSGSVGTLQDSITNNTHERWRGVDQRVQNETITAPHYTTTPPHAPQYHTIVGAESDDEMDFDCAEYEAYWERMESRLVKIELLLESLDSMMRRSDQRMNDAFEATPHGTRSANNTQGLVPNEGTTIPNISFTPEGTTILSLSFTPEGTTIQSTNIDQSHTYNPQTTTTTLQLIFNRILLHDVNATMKLHDLKGWLKRDPFPSVDFYSYS